MGNQSFINAIRDVKRAIFRFTYQSPYGVKEYGFKGKQSNPRNISPYAGGIYAEPSREENWSFVILWHEVSSIEISEPAFPYKEGIPTITFYLK